MLLIITGGVLLCYSTSNAQVANMIFSIKPADQDYLRYLLFRNQFDSAGMNCYFGEFRLSNGGTITRLFLNHGTQCNTVLQGDSAAGENSNLLPYTRTENFTMPSGTPQLNFYRNMTLFRIPCDEFGGGAGGGHVGGGGDGNGSFWMMGQGRIQDKTEFVTKLIRASDNAVLAVIDSIGILTNPYSDTAFVYGTSPVKTKHTRMLPTGYSGTSVYLQVSPRRWGSTPYGIDMKHECDVMLNFSSVIDSLGNGNQNSAIEDTIPKLQKALLFSYCDSIFTATGDLPDFHSTPGFSLMLEPPVSDSFRNKYFDSETMPNGNKIYRVKSAYAKTSSLFGNTSKNGITAKNNGGKTKDALIEIIQPTPVSSNAEITIKANKDIINASLYVYTIKGQQIAKLWTGNLTKGSNKVNSNFSEYANGTYGIYCNNEAGETMDFKKIIIAK